MVFGEPLGLPGEFFVSSDGDMAADPAFVVDLRQKIRLLWPIPPVWHGGESRRSYVSQELSTATYVVCASERIKHRCNHRTKGHSKYLKDARNISSWT